jgi:hypothetical protein
MGWVTKVVEEVTSTAIRLWIISLGRDPALGSEHTMMKKSTRVVSIGHLNTNYDDWNFTYPAS